MTDNTRNNGGYNWAKISRALIQHRDDPIDGIKFSPAQLPFGRSIRDFQPILPGKFKPHEVWVDCVDKRELAMHHRLSLGPRRGHRTPGSSTLSLLGRRWSSKTRGGGSKLTKKWDGTETVVEDISHEKYSVKIDGSGRLKDRNRRYLGAFKPDTLTSLQTPSPLTQPPTVPHGQGQQGHRGDLPDPVAVQDDEEGDLPRNITPQTTQAGLPGTPPRPTHQASSPGPTPLPTPTYAKEIYTPNVRHTTERVDLTRD